MQTRIDKPSITKELLKWVFTWVLAVIPISFSCVRDIIQFGHINGFDICKSGEIFLVAIVMVAEPLVSLITGKQKWNSIVLLIFIVVCIIEFGYSYALLEAGREHEEHYHNRVEMALRADTCDCNTSGKEINLSQPLIRKFFKGIPYASPYTRFQDDSITTIVEMPTKSSCNKECASDFILCFERDGCQRRIITFSKISLWGAFFLGFSALIVSHENNEEEEENGSDPKKVGLFTAFRRFIIFRWQEMRKKIVQWLLDHTNHSHSEVNQQHSSVVPKAVIIIGIIVLFAVLVLYLLNKNKLITL